MFFLIEIYVVMIVLGFVVVGPAVIIAMAVNGLMMRYRIKSLVAYCGIDMIDALMAEPAEVGRMIYEKLNEKAILLGYRNERLKKQMKDAGINEEADDYGYEKRTFIFSVKTSPDTQTQETTKIEFIDFWFADLRKKMEKIRWVFTVKEQLKKELIRHFKMVVCFDKI